MRALAAIAIGLTAAFCAGIANASACDNHDTDGADVALVLSGGGALAVVQSGALSVIEEIGVPIHCVAGTSMGAVIGAFYAAGYDAGEIEAIFTDSDWAEIFSSDIPRRDKSYLQKENEELYFSGYVAGFSEEGVTLPGGLRSMNGLQRFFREKLAHIETRSDFDRLRVPFRAAVADLSTGEAVALKEGDLVEAMLASMAVPGAFPGRVIEGKTYVDGGLAAQLPVQIAKDLGADIIIAIDTTIEPPAINGPVSITEMTQQLIRISVWKNWKEQVALLGEHDVLIRPDISQFTTSSFERAPKAIETGRAEAEKFAARLTAIKAQAAPPRDNLIDPHAAPARDGPLVILNESDIDEDVIRRRFGEDTARADDPAQMHRRLRELAAFGGFGETDLSYANGSPVLSVNRRPLGRNLLQAGLKASTSFDGDSAYGVLARFSRAPFSRRGGEFSLSGEIGSDIGLTAQLYRPLGKGGRFFVIPALAYRSEKLLLDVQDFRIAELRRQVGQARVRLGRELGDWGVVGIEGAVEIGRFEPKVAVLPELLETQSFAIAGGGVFAGVDTLDRTDWPTSGFQFRGSFHELFDFEDSARTEKFNLFAQKALQVRNFGVLLRGQFQGVESEGVEPVEILNLGGFRRLSAFSEDSLPNNQYVLGSIEVFRRLDAADRVVTFPLYAGVMVEYANVKFDIFETNLAGNFVSGGFYLGADTALGPAFFGAGFSEEGQHSLFFHFGRGF